MQHLSASLKGAYLTLKCAKDFVRYLQEFMDDPDFRNEYRDYEALGEMKGEGKAVAGLFPQAKAAAFRGL
ncbi:hypothetical protein OEW28_14055 [Defluviimonas sp. WL0002]|uniref:Uncharacterized protein n=1 Tax=Albidovulum marisflavi TaxID=2984159 RepID=A0ABT2ZF37_9RHOB|nr:hypothetical protein [Defluviimonas sp. WL0002]MCV2869754.1 hypothetical protein [Defluviimonas sp. WL0002]